MLTQVRDIYCAAFLVAKGVRLDHTETAGDGFINFYFPERECGPILTEWYSPDATVNVHEYRDALKELQGITKRQRARY